MNARRLIAVTVAYVCGDLVLFIAGLGARRIARERQEACDLTLPPPPWVVISGYASLVMIVLATATTIWALARTRQTGACIVAVLAATATLSVGLGGSIDDYSWEGVFLCSWLATQVAAIVVVLIILIRSRDVIAVVAVAAALAHSMVLSIRPGDALLPDITVWRIAAPIIGALIVLLVVRAVRQPDRWVSTLLSITVVALFYGSTFLGTWVTYFPAGYDPSVCGG